MCDKDPLHTSSYPISSLKVEQLPALLQEKSCMHFIQLIGSLVVRVVVSSKSMGCLTQEADGKRSKLFHYLLGTGNALDKHDDVLAQFLDIQQKESKHIFVKETILCIETNRMLMDMETDPRNCLVEFFYDPSHPNKVKKVKCVAIFHSPTVGELKSYLVCQSNDQEFVQWLDRTRGELSHLAEELPVSVKEYLCRHVLIIGHPHGGQQTMSYSELAEVHYLVKLSEIQLEGFLKVESLELQKGTYTFNSNLHFFL